MSDNQKFLTDLQNKKISWKYILENFSYENFRNISLENIIFEDCEIHNISVVSDDFRYCIFKNCEFFDGEIIGSVFENCKIISLQFSKINFAASFINCEITELHQFL